MTEQNNTPAEFGAPAPYAEGTQPVNPYAEQSAPAEGVHAPEPVTLDAGDLLAELEAEARRGLDQVVMIAVPSRPGWALAASTFITQAELKNWQVRSPRAPPRHRPPGSWTRPAACRTRPGWRRTPPAGSRPPRTRPCAARDRTPRPATPP